MATANAGYHAYATGDVLTAAQVQYNLQNQTTMYFASASARTTALSGVLVEGMVSYIPANGIEYYNGSAWVSISQAVTALTTKGDLLTYSTQDTRLPVGANGTSLVADSSQTTGLGWTATPSASNPIINSAMQVWQRGTSFAIASSTATYTADRWCVQRNATGSTISRQATGDTTNLPFIQYGLRIQRDSGNTSTQLIAASQSFESVNSIPFAGKTITVSFYAKAGANYSSASSVFKMQIYSGTGTDQNVLSGLTGSALVIDGSATLTTTYQRFTFTGTVAATATQLAIYSFYTPVGTAGANDWAEITGVQIDIGSVALPFRTFSQTLQGELQACRRYLPAYSGSNNDNIMGYSYATNNAIYGFQFDTPARVYPTGITATGTFYGYANNTQYTITPVWNAAGPNGASVVGSPTIVVGQGSRLFMTIGSLLLFTGCEL